MTTQTEIEELIKVYLTAWNARDFEGMAALFTEPATYVIPGGTLHIPDHQTLIEKLKQQFAGLERDGLLQRPREPFYQHALVRGAQRVHLLSKKP